MEIPTSLLKFLEASLLPVMPPRFCDHQSLLRKRLGAPHFPRLLASRTRWWCCLISPFSPQTSLFEHSHGWCAVFFHYLRENGAWRWILFFVGGAPPVYTSSHKWQTRSEEGSSLFFPTFIINHHGFAAHLPICTHSKCFLSTMDDLETAWDSFSESSNT